MDGLNRGELLTIGKDQYLLTGSFAVNGGSAVDQTTRRGTDLGFPFSVTYAATGQFTVTLPSGMGFVAQPGSIVVSPQWDAVANWFDVAVVGDFNLTARSFLIQAHRSGTANAPPAGTGARINFAIKVSNTTGR